MPRLSGRLRTTKLSQTSDNRLRSLALRHIILTMAEVSRKEKLKKAVKVFFTSLGISSVAFGGGFVVLPMLRKTYVDKYKWVTDDDMDNYIALAQACPGTIAGNTTMLIGFQVAGLLGSLLAMIASIIPPLAIITVLSILYHNFIENVYVGYLMSGMRAAAAAVIISLVCDMAKPFFKHKNLFEIALFILGFCLAFLTDISVIFIILGAAVIGIIFTYIKLAVERKKAQKANNSDKEGGE